MNKNVADISDTYYRLVILVRILVTRIAILACIFLDRVGMFWVFFFLFFFLSYVLESCLPF